jgi:pSer/pThr/pTyr-binding forkhead associated (FHA) protein
MLTKPQMVMIRDIGSTHGTYLNNTALEQKKQRSVSDNDIVVFGTEVRRGSEVFPACAFRINYEFVPYK